MTDLARIRVAWSGTPVTGPGLSTFYVTNADIAGKPANLLTYFTALRNFIPAGVTITVPSSGDVLDDATGDLVGVWSTTGGGSTTGNGGAAPFLAGTGARARWITLGIVGGRRVTGTTYIVPMTAQELGSGIVQSSTVTAMSTAGATLLTNTSNLLRIWSKPVTADPDADPPIAARAGSSYVITATTTPNAMTWLRSRRT